MKNKIPKFKISFRLTQISLIVSFFIIMLLPTMPGAGYIVYSTWENKTWKFDVHDSTVRDITDFNGRETTLKFEKYAHYHAQATRTILSSSGMGTEFSVTVDYYPDAVSSWSWGPTLKLSWSGGGTAWIKDQSGTYTSWGMSGQPTSQEYNRIRSDHWYRLRIQVTSSNVELSYDRLDDSNDPFILMSASKHSSMTGSVSVSVGTDRLSDYSSPGPWETYYYDEFRLISGNQDAGDLSSYCIKEISPTWIQRSSSNPVIQGDDTGQWFDLQFRYDRDLLYYGDSKTRIYINSNGFVLFDPSSIDFSTYSNYLSVVRNHWMIAPFWDDLRTDRSGGVVTNPGVYMEYIDDSSGLLITWEATKYGNPSASIKFQIVLYYYGDIKINIGDSTNLGSFSETGVFLGKATWIDYINGDLDPSDSHQSWKCTYDYYLGNFMYDRVGYFAQPASYRILMPGPPGWTDEYGISHSGPPYSRLFVPNYIRWEWSNQPDNGYSAFSTTMEFNLNLYELAEEWAGPVGFFDRSFAYVNEYMIPRAHTKTQSANDIIARYSNLPGHQWNVISAEYWDNDQVPTFETDVHVFNPEEIPVNVEYYIDYIADMADGYEIQASLAQESELYEDQFPFVGIILNQRDWYKQWLGTFWGHERTVTRFGCNPPKNLTALIQKPAQTVSITSAEILTYSESPNNSMVQALRTEVDIRRWVHPNSSQSLQSYINQRKQAAQEIYSNLDPSTTIPITITFSDPLNRKSFLRSMNKYHITVEEYGMIGSDGGSGRFRINEGTQLINEIAEKMIEEKHNIKLHGIISLYGAMKVRDLLKLQMESEILLVDPLMDLEIIKIQSNLQKEGAFPKLLYTTDIWNLYKQFG